MRVSDAQQSARVRELWARAASRSRIEFRALLVVIFAGCGLDDVPEVPVRDAAYVSDAAADEHPMDRAEHDVGAVTPAQDAAASVILDGGTSTSAELTSATEAAVARPIADAGMSTAEAFPDVAASPSDETPPVSRCNAGSYEGTFASIPMGLLPPEMVAGKATLELTPIMGQDRLSLTGLLQGTSQGGFAGDDVPVSARIRALLNCATHQIEAGELLDATGAVGGALEGVYSDNPPSLSGTWTTGGALLGLGGRWSASPKAP